jgi:hypothetical protein
MGKNQAIAGLACGVTGLVFALISGRFPYLALLSLPLAIVGLVLSVIGGKKLQAENLPKGIATAGLVVGIVATVFGAITFFTCGLCVLCVASAEKAAEDALEDALKGLKW